MYYRYATGKFERIIFNPDYHLPEKDIPTKMHCLVPGDEGKLIIGSNDVYELDKKSLKYRKILKGNMVRPFFFILKDNHNDYWLGSNTDCLWRLDKKI
ncbi:MAG: hypothetical protein HC830_09560 [Bacteroidetes bacterium]|nr:hypothetical protein [Bacteroidota bacterium]